MADGSRARRYRATAGYPNRASDLPGCGYLNLGFEYEGRRTDCMSGISVDRVASATLELAKHDFAAAVAKGDRGSTADAGRIPRGVLAADTWPVLFRGLGSIRSWARSSRRPARRRHALAGFRDAAPRYINRNSRRGGRQTQSVCLTSSRSLQKSSSREVEKVVRVSCLSPMRWVSLWCRSLGYAAAKFRSSLWP